MVAKDREEEIVVLVAARRKVYLKIRIDDKEDGSSLLPEPSMASTT